jgi:toxin ParE1/3/4
MAEANKKLLWAPKAEQDLRNIWIYFARVASEDIADKILNEIDRSTARLASRPYLGRPRDEVMAGLRGLLVQPHTVFYRVSDPAVEIIRVLHERRDFAAILRKDEP